MNLIASINQLSLQMRQVKELIQSPAVPFAGHIWRRATDVCPCPGNERLVVHYGEPGHEGSWQEKIIADAVDWSRASYWRFDEEYYLGKKGGVK